MYGAPLDVADVVDRREVGVVQDPRRPRLLLESAQAIRVDRKGRRQHLDGDLSSQARIPRSIDLTHPASSERRDDLVGPQTRAGNQGQVRHRVYRTRWPDARETETARASQPTA